MTAVVSPDIAMRASLIAVIIVRGMDEKQLKLAEGQLADKAEREEFRSDLRSLIDSIFEDQKRKPLSELVEEIINRVISNIEMRSEAEAEPASTGS